MKVDVSLLRDLESRRLISIQQHPELPLLIHNYTPACQYGRAWDDMTKMCRGLITDLEGNIVSRPFPKFFNLTEHDDPHTDLPLINWALPFSCTRKMDGSLGILYPTPNGPAIATRGSFTSEQANRANEIFKKHGYDKHAYAPDLTYLFEIIYPENRIVVDYGDMEDLVLLEIIDIETGRAFDWEYVKMVADRIGCPVVNYLSLSAENIQRLEEYFGQSNGGTEEGIVVRFSNGRRVKVKYEEYVRLHRLITGVSARKIWEHLKWGTGFEKLLENVPDEFNEWVRKTVAELMEKFDLLKAEIEHVYMKIEESFLEAHIPLGTVSQKEWAMEILKYHEISSALFSKQKGKNYDDFIWTKIKPPSSTPFKDDEQ